MVKNLEKPKATFHSVDDSPRLVVPKALVSVLTTLISELPDVPTETRVQLRCIRSALCRVYRLKDPQAAISEVDAGQEEQELDGIPLEDAP